MISVIIPVHNTEKYIDECIDSVTRQTYKDLEIICIVSGNDDSLRKIMEHQKKDKRVQIIEDENCSYGHKLNIGILNASGDYIAIVDSDDYIDENMYMDMFAVMKDSNLDYVKSNYTCFYTDSGTNILLDAMHCINDDRFYDKALSINNNISILFESNICIWSGLYSKRFIIDNNIKLNESIGASFQDAGFALLMNVYADRVYFMSNSYYRYRVDNVNSSVKDDSKSLIVFDEIKWINKQLDKNRNISYERVWNTKKRVIDILYWNYNRLEEKEAVRFSGVIKAWLKIEFIDSQRIDDLQDRLKEEILTMYYADTEYTNGYMKFLKEKNILPCHCMPNEIEVSIILLDDRNDSSINESLLSILQQELREIQIFVLQTACNDNCNKYIKLDRRINFLVNAYKEWKYCVNKLVLNAQGKYIMVLHSSEILYQDSINQMLGKIREKNSNALSFICDCYKNGVCYLSNESDSFNVLPVLIKKSEIIKEQLFFSDDTIANMHIYKNRLLNSIAYVCNSDYRWMRKEIE